MIGRFLKDVGRPENVYFGGDLREDLARHEVYVTQTILDMRPDTWVRLWDVDKKVSRGRGNAFSGDRRESVRRVGYRTNALSESLAQVQEIWRTACG